MYCKEFLEDSPCKGPIKPNITFFGEGLPKEFFAAWDKIEDLELDADEDEKEPFANFTKGMLEEIEAI